MKNNKNSRPCVQVDFFTFCCGRTDAIQLEESDLDYESIDPEAIAPDSVEEFREMLAEAWGINPEGLLTECPEDIREISNWDQDDHLCVWAPSGQYCFKYLPAGWEADE